MINTDQIKSEIAEFLNLKLNNDLITQNIIPIPESINPVTENVIVASSNLQPREPQLKPDFNQTLRIHKTSSNQSSTQLTQPNHTDRNSARGEAEHQDGPHVDTGQSEIDIGGS